jgi:hypothetical protein
MSTYATGVGFAFGGSTFTVTSITYSLGASGATDQIDASHLGLTTGATVISLSRPLKGTPGGDTGKSVSIEYIGTVPIAQDASGTLTITGPVSVSGTATCQSSSVTLTLNDIVRGSAEFQLA